MVMPFTMTAPPPSTPPEIFETWLIRMGLSSRSNLGVSASGIYADFN